jgi:hypothetical protein
VTALKWKACLYRITHLWKISVKISLPQRGILCFKSALGLKSEAPRFKRNIIVVDAKRFCIKSKTDEVFGTHRLIRKNIQVMKNPATSFG